MPHSSGFKDRTPLIGVGFLVVGPVSQAMHLPGLSRLAEPFALAHVMDIDGGVACASPWESNHPDLSPPTSR